MKAVREGGSRLDDEAHLIAALRAGEEPAFVLLVERYQVGEGTGNERGP